jgi:mannose-1-phosphate guanylyltransferase/mannose-1-phosphate guanylyltransferase/mannose-6-phosphate isomerase
MFLFRCSQLIDEVAQYAPEVLRACEQAVNGIRTDDDFLRLDGNAYAQSPDIAIDYALMEHTRQAAMVKLEAGWSDIGSWSSVWQISQHDSRDNALRGDTLIEDCEGCLVHSETRLIAAVGLKDAVIVDTPDALLVMNKDRAQDTRQLVRRLLEHKRSEATSHRQVTRPWGSYDAIGNGTRFQVKRITVQPGARLSLQMHHHRAEHWIVVSGTARVIDGEKDYLLTENQSTFIGVGVIHSLENPGKIPLELIEVQSGSYLGEDDIIRLSDAYGRA